MLRLVVLAAMVLAAPGAQACLGACTVPRLEVTVEGERCPAPWNATCVEAPDGRANVTAEVDFVYGMRDGYGIDLPATWSVAMWVRSEGVAWQADPHVFQVGPAELAMGEREVGPNGPEIHVRRTVRVSLDAASAERHPPLDTLAVPLWVLANNPQSVELPTISGVGVVVLTGLREQADGNAPGSQAAREMPLPPLLALGAAFVVLALCRR